MPLAVRGSTMMGLWVEDGRPRLRDDIPRPVAPAGWALVAITTAGICGTDLQILRGYAGFTGVLGHEFVGRVVDGSPQWLDRRVVGEINVGCGRCTRCLASDGGHCASRQVLGIRDLNGAFAEFLVLPERNLHAIPDSVTDEEASFVEPLAAALRIAEQVEITASARLLVVGDGRLGQSRTDTLGDLERRHATVMIPRTAVGQRDADGFFLHFDGHDRTSLSTG